MRHPDSVRFWKLVVPPLIFCVGVFGADFLLLFCEIPDEDFDGKASRIRNAGECLGIKELKTPTIGSSNV